MTMRKLLLVLMASALTSLFYQPSLAEEEAEEKGPMSSGTFSGLQFRSLGPALTSGRIADFAVDPANPARYFVAVCCGNVWRTTNSGTTWTPVFDDQGSYSIGCVALDPRNPLVVWIGTGENNSQRSVGYGDGLYKSLDGGDSWEKVGLENSEHIAKILIDPRDSDVVYVAAQGPLWNPGGDRGLHKTTDGGKSWELILEIDENTGVTDVVMDPRDPDVLFAASYQRRRHVWVLIDGGPGSGIHKSVDGGKTWTELAKGLPSGDMGRIGLAVSPADPDIVYAIIEAADEGSGFYRSTDSGVNWEKRSDHISTSPQYYQEIVADPVDPEKVYSLDTVSKVTHDGGATFENLGREGRHVDDHALWIDPRNTDHLIIGGDGGIYETWDAGKNWHFKANLPVTQFYRVCVDNDLPFYNLYGGTQDNNTIGGPSRTINRAGITNSDWFITKGGDGFEPQVDPENPDIVYSQMQHGGLVRYDRRSGERIDIQPKESPGDPPNKWNWNSPLLISPHSPTRLYFACQRLYRSDDRGDSWIPVSGDLTRQIDRNRLKVMGRVWGVNTVAKNRNTSWYGSIVFVDESPLREGLLYAGTDDGLIQVSPDGGGTWRRIETVRGVPEMSYVSCVRASLHDENTVYATFDNHKKGDFLPYVQKSTDRGGSWTSISGDLPERGTVYTLVEDHVRPGLLFVGTEFGVFFTVDDGERWIQLKNGIPTTVIRDLDIQRRESDLVVASFGRGFYILDDYSPLREIDDEALELEAILFPVKKSWMFIERSRTSGSQGAAFFKAENPPVGAVFTYYMEEAPKTLESRRREREKEVAKEGGDVFYPTWDELRAEDREREPELVLVVRDDEGNVVRRITAKAEKGIHRASWDFRFPPPNPVSLTEDGSSWSKPTGPLAVPGTYTVSMELTARGETKILGEPQLFEIEPLGLATLPAEDKAAALAFHEKTAHLQRAVLGAQRAADEAQKRIDYLRKAFSRTPSASPAILDEIGDIEARLKDLLITLRGDRILSRANEPTPLSIAGRVGDIVWGGWYTSSAPTKTQMDSYDAAAAQFVPVLEGLRRIAKVDLVAVEEKLEAAGAPWTPGRVPEWSPE